MCHELLGGEEDTISSLEELVTFIDAWDADSSRSLGDVTTSESENDSSPFSNDDVESMLLDSLDDVLEKASFLPDKQPEAKKAVKRSRKKAPGASTRLQRRKKAEILALRAQSHELQRELEQLQRVHARSSASVSLVDTSLQSGVVPISWYAIAATEYQERLKSEIMNQKLRYVLLEQMKMNTALRGVFQTQTSLGVSINLRQFYLQVPTADLPSPADLLHRTSSLSSEDSLPHPINARHLNQNALMLS